MNRPLIFISLLFLSVILLATGCAPGSAAAPTATVSSEPTTATETAVVPPPTATDVPEVETATPPTEPTAVPTQEVIIPAPPEREAIDQVTAVAADAIAYVQNDQVFIRTLPDGEPLPLTEPCATDLRCTAIHLKWSPDGQYLLFYYDDGIEISLRLSDRAGQTQSIADPLFLQPAAWAPDSNTFAYFRKTDTLVEADEVNMAGWLNEVVTVTVAEDGTLEPATVVGTWTQREGGCGGGGRSLSEVLYENEGGTSYGYLMGVTEWSAQNILLFTTNCTQIGIGRFDMTTGEELPGYERPLRNLTLNNEGDRWYAVTGEAWDTADAEDNLLVTGTPDSVEVTTIPTSAKVELVFVGETSGTLYYTERTPLARESNDQLGVFLAEYEAAIWQLAPDGSDEQQLLAEEGAHAYAQLTETAVGDLLYVMVENERPFFEAAQIAEIDQTALIAYLPQRHIMQLSADGGTPTAVLTSAGQPALALP